MLNSFDSELDMYKKCSNCGRLSDDAVVNKSYTVCLNCEEAKHTTIQQLEVLKGFIKGDKFNLTGILMQDAYGTFKADGLESLAMLINNEGFSFTIDKIKQITINQDDAIQMQKELYIIVDYFKKTNKKGWNGAM